MDNNSCKRGGCLMTNTASVNFDLGDFEKNMIKLANQSDLYTKSQMKGAKYIADKLAANTPIGEESNGVLLSEDVKYQDVDGISMIGYGKKTYYRAHFAEVGTDNQSGQHFIEKTMLEESKNTMDIVMQNIKKGLKL